jgi:hypothetical protein
MDMFLSFPVNAEFAEIPLIADLRPGQGKSGSEEERKIGNRGNQDKTTLPPLRSSALPIFLTSSARSSL